jgi:hypothetical protein
VSFDGLDVTVMMVLGMLLRGRHLHFLGEQICGEQEKKR